MEVLTEKKPIECVSCAQALSCLNLSCKRNTVLYGASNCNYICAYQ